MQNLKMGISFNNKNKKLYLGILIIWIGPLNNSLAQKVKKKVILPYHEKFENNVLLFKIICEIIFTKNEKFNVDFLGDFFRYIYNPKP